ncbi:MchE protein-like OS=Blastopirellula marina DSM 3645 GN=DSM3645_14760 PE=4 SV=1: Biotin_lipoyl_2 [Gemmataceae bacterium]|nr:MchE protein-like OS=Blastopirellula marina DSM 3645 GN=DSM3645_14760 PE=4 SV=1: Biotin_lipoyl_2 [Gemmataceae bacterium]VTU01463.1 MchE protein-like OS=Blastopirellula marina DSM 3645 GN=DSM3645_14760 PE=4 SV=1: Biotin_lipoyl_2 [Gemmataceae bacterium]
MRFWNYLSPALTVLAVGGVGFAAYATRERWLPHVFPMKPGAKTDGHDAKAEGHDDHAGHDHGPRGDRVKLSPQAQANLGLDKDGAVDSLTPTEYWRRVPVPGVIVDRPGESDRGVTSKVAGIVTEIKARPGDTVKAGDPLFTLQLVSEFLQGVQTDLAKAARELEFAMTKRDRVASLVKAGTQSGAVLIEEENQVKRVVTQIQAYRRQLQVFGMTQEQVDRAEKGEVVTAVTVFAPAGPATGWLPFPSADDALLYEVQELSVQRGAQVQAGQTLCLLANHQRLFVEGQAFASETKPLAAAAAKSLPIRVEFPGEAPGDWPEVPPLVVHHMGSPPAAGATFPFYLPLENQYQQFTQGGKNRFAWRFRPGQRVRLRLPVEKIVTLGPDGKTELLPFVLPAGAVVREGAEAFVFVQSGDVFVKKAVQVLYEDRNEAVIARGGSVSAADFVVRTSAAAAINRALKAAAAGEGGGGGDHHGHSHD